MAANSMEGQIIDPKAQAQNLLRQKLDEIEKNVIPGLQQFLSERNKEDDVMTFYVKGKALEIQKLREEIESFKNPDKHFTKQYRTFEGHCSNFQTSLDRIDVFGRDDLKQLRKQALVDLDELIKTLDGKVHSNGMVCRKCEVQN